jgi:hypothetical protein
MNLSTPLATMELSQGQSALAAGTIVTFQGLVGASVLNGHYGVVVQPSPFLNPSPSDPVPIADEAKVEVIISNQTMTLTGRSSQYLKLSIDKVVKGPPIGLSIRNLSVDPEDLGIVESYDSSSGMVSIKMSHDDSIRCVELLSVLPSELFDLIWNEFENVRHEFLEKGKQLYFKGGKGNVNAAAAVCIFTLIQSSGTPVSPVKRKTLKLCTRLVKRM